MVVVGLGELRANAVDRANAGWIVDAVSIGSQADYGTYRSMVVLTVCFAFAEGVGWILPYFLCKARFVRSKRPCITW